MNHDPITVLDRVSHAIQSSDLRMVEHRVGDADYIAALGMAGINLSAQAEVVFFGEASGDDAEAADVATPTLSMVAIWACTAAVVLIGVVPGILSGLANDATLFSILG